MNGSSTEKKHKKIEKNGVYIYRIENGIRYFFSSQNVQFLANDTEWSLIVIFFSEGVLCKGI